MNYEEQTTKLLVNTIKQLEETIYSQSYEIDALKIENRILRDEDQEKRTVRFFIATMTDEEVCQFLDNPDRKHQDWVQTDTFWQKI